MQTASSLENSTAQSSIYSSIVLISSHPPLNRSFHKLTRLSPVLTARTLPLRDQLARHATASKFRVVDFHSPESYVSNPLLSNVTYTLARAHTNTWIGACPDPYRLVL